MPDIQRRHHVLVRIAHAANVPILLGLMASGLSIYWASPVYRIGGYDPIGYAGWWLQHRLGGHSAHPLDTLYDLLSLGPYQLANGLRLHWLLAYACMANAGLYAVGLLAGRGWRALVPRVTDAGEMGAMIRYYVRLGRGPHPPSATHYNGLQRLAYGLVLLAGLLAVWSGWALHKPNTLPWLAAPLGGYDGARAWHFWLMLFLAAFAVVHTVLVVFDGWDTLRSMVVGWSTRTAADSRVSALPPGQTALRPDAPVETVPSETLQRSSRRAFLLAVPGTALGWGAALWLLPSDTWSRLLGHSVAANPTRDKLFDNVLRFDDDVAEALFSPTRSVPTYAPADATPNLRNNYNGRTPDPAYLAGWKLQWGGTTLTLADLQALPFVQETTRLICVEGWSAIAWWGGHRLGDVLARWPPPPGTRFLQLRSGVNLDGDGHPDPYYVSIDLATAAHAQTMLATHYHGEPLTVEHGAPLRLVAPMKLGLKNIKAITEVVFCPDEPADYWADRGYSRYDGV